MYTKIMTNRSLTKPEAFVEMGFNLIKQAGWLADVHVFAIIC